MVFSTISGVGKAEDDQESSLSLRLRLDRPERAWDMIALPTVSGNISGFCTVVDGSAFDSAVGGMVMGDIGKLLVTARNRKMDA